LGIQDTAGAALSQLMAGAPRFWLPSPDGVI
jgi:hypothetical protein